MLDWEKYTEIASRFQHKAKAGDRDDLKQDIILRLAEIASNNGQLTFPAMLRIASFVTQEYWRDLKRKPSLLSLNYELEDEDGNTVELWQTLADDNSINVEDWVDARRWLLGCPRRLVQIAVKCYSGKPLTNKEKCYWHRQRKKELKKYQLALLK